MIARRPMVIEHIAPAVDGGRHPVKRQVGDRVAVSADIFRDGHELLAAQVLYRIEGEAHWRTAPLRPVDNDRWAGEFAVDRNARYRFLIEAWTDTWSSWTEEMRRRIAGGQRDLASELAEGAALVRAAASRAEGGDAAPLRRALAEVEAAPDQDRRAAVLLASDLHGPMARAEARTDLTRSAEELEVVVDRPRAAFAAWYELFPRSQAPLPAAGAPPRHGTFADCIKRLPDIQRMGFDVLYLPPIHPIGRSHRKGPNNSLEAGPGDPGSPWAIGGPEGGHTAIHPELGTLGDFRALVEAAAEHGIEVALDLAFQCSPDHPWIAEHPEWFRHRPDGSIKYAENPPKKYQDIVPIDFGGPEAAALWRALLDVVLFWAAQGILTFRVDNPHTKPIDFWRWLIREVQDRHPGAIFLSEAFTRPKVMRALAKAGFTQSYTYFTWRNTAEELRAYLEELTRTESAEYFRPHFFTNTPDILPDVLQRGGRPAFRLRAALAATLSPLWGIYSGFELCEAAALSGTEEYLDSEKYQLRPRDWDAPGNIKDEIARLNRIRRENPALQRLGPVTFYATDSPHVLVYSRVGPGGDNALLVAANLDPFAPREARVEVPAADLGLDEAETYELHELLTGSRRLARGSSHVIQLDPGEAPVAIWRVERWRRRETQFDYF
ncbi:MAG: alpha-1,4-glucan--maltose-1-phosphate maltosyltransferase [Candidatus Rokubacteria bacterium]|nr:alpha-1,4-glucan--maltose-1-phosphate maltosyltransferase [Candidatus Rokubacteria bacterium]